MQTEIDPSPTPAPHPAPAAKAVELELGDGSRLVLEDAAASPIICRIEGHEADRITLEDTLRLPGQPFAGFRRLR